MTRPSTAITVSCPDETMRLRSVTGPMRSGVNRRGNADRPGAGVGAVSSSAIREAWRGAASGGAGIAHAATDGQASPREPGRAPAIVPAMEDRAIAARWLGRVRLPRRVGPPEATRGRARRRRDRRPAAAARASRRPDARPAGRRGARPRDRRRARRAGHRGAARRARRRGDLPRARAAGGLPDPAPRGPRAPPAAVRPGARGGAHRHVRAPSASRPAGATGTRAAGSSPTARRRARSARSGSASSAGWRTTASPSTSDVDLADFDLIDPCGMPGLVSTSIAAEQGRRERRPVHGRRRASRGGVRACPRAPPRCGARRGPAAGGRPGRRARGPRAARRRRAGLIRIGEGT